MDFANAYAQGFARVAARVLPVHLAQPAKNARAVIEDVRWLDHQGVCLAAYPELGLTGYTCGDLFGQAALLDAAEEALGAVVAASADYLPVVVVGVPLRHGNRVFDCAAVIHRGVLLGVVPKTYLAPGRGAGEERWFLSGSRVDARIVLPRAGLEAAFAARQIFECADVPGLAVYAGFSEDFLPVPSAAIAARQGATVLVGMGASPATLGIAPVRRTMGAALSARCRAAYVFTTAGPGESSNDAAWDGQTFVYECGDLVAQSGRFPSGPAGTIADIDLTRITRERYDPAWATDSGGGPPDRGLRTTFRLAPPSGELGLRRIVPRFPFIPDDSSAACEEAFDIQVSALAQRLSAIGDPKPVIGVSGGLDSTQALVVAVKAMDLAGRPRSDILGFTMPGFATSDTTNDLANRLMEALGITHATVDIRAAARQMLSDLGHPFADGEPLYDITFENVQAGLRADYLFRIANQRGGIVIGTGDLSELALGWCTYGVGDHMSHYAVNAGVPKTLIRHLLHWVATTGQVGKAAGKVITAILGLAISPELVPPGESGDIQSTEGTIGPYDLHDFFLYHFLRRGEMPSRIAYLAAAAWADSQVGHWPLSWPEDRKVSYDLPTIRKWLEAFLKRFFANQFKRSAGVDGPQVSPGGSLGPRGGWRMPSDAAAPAWLEELANNVPDMGV